MSIRCLFFLHKMKIVHAYYDRLWCDVGYECTRCGYREERHEDHWENRHKELQLDCAGSKWYG